MTYIVHLLQRLVPFRHSSAKSSPHISKKKRILQTVSNNYQRIHIGISIATALLNLNPISARRRPGASPRFQCSLVHLAGDRGDILHRLHRLHRSDRGGLDVFKVRLFEDAGHVGRRSLEKPRLLGCGYGFRIYPWRRWRSHVFKDVSTWSGTMGNMCR